MINAKDELSHAVSLCLGYGVAQFPTLDSAKLVQFYGPRKGMDLFEKVVALTNEASLIDIDWSNVDLESAGRVIRAEMGIRYPALAIQALDAMAWKFTYDWR